MLDVGCYGVGRKEAMDLTAWKVRKGSGKRESGTEFKKNITKRSDRYCEKNVIFACRNINHFNIYETDQDSMLH
jgi:hypothetical protein